MTDLKRAIDRVHSIRMRGIIHSTELSSVELEAWRTAFEWRDGIDRRREHFKLEGVIHSGALYGEYQAGMRQIREKLQ